MIDICKNFVKYILIKRNYRFIGTKKQRNKGTKEQRNKGTKEQRNKETKKQRNKGTKKELCKINYIKNKQYIIYDKSI